MIVLHKWVKEKMATFSITLHRYNLSVVVFPKSLNLKKMYSRLIKNIVAKRGFCLKMLFLIFGEESFLLGLIEFLDYYSNIQLLQTADLFSSYQSNSTPND